MPATNGRSRNGYTQRTFTPDSPDERRAKSAKVEGIADAMDRTPPQNLEAERGVLGSVLYEPFFMDDLIGKLSPDDFYSDANRQIFIAMNNIHAAGRRVDATLLHDRLVRSNMLEHVGGVAYLMEIADSVPHAHNCLYYAEFVREAATRRRMIHACTEGLRGLFDPTSDCRAVASGLETKIADAAAARDADALKHFGDVAASCVNQFKVKKSKPKEQRRGVRSSLYSLDNIMGPYECGQVTLIAARTSVGKTAFVTSQVAQWLESTDLVGHFCTLEMSDLELAERILCAGCSIDMTRYRDGLCGEDEIARIESWWRTENNVARKLFIDHAAERTVGEIMAMARRTRRIAGRLDYVIIDYIQLIQGDGDRWAKRHEEVSKISRAIKVGARALDVPMIVLCQLNREADAGRPRLSHLRESGALEQDADKVVFIDRQTEGDDAATSTAQLIVAKNRFGKTGECSAAFYGNFQRFANMQADLAF